jgi:hypothetical protein
LDGNDFWALRALAALAELTPQDCEPLLWMAWISMKHGSMSDAREHLLAARCAPDTVSQTRWALLLAMLEQHTDHQEMALLHLASARAATDIYEEDRVVMDRLTSALDPGYISPFAGKIELTLGGSSNARAGSPADPADEGEDAASPTGQLNLWLRFVGPTGRWIRPSMEAEARSLGYTADQGRDLSFFMGSLRPGVIVGDSTPSGLLAYRFDALLLAGGDRYENGPLWFYNAHRAELEVNLLPNLSLFGGFGRRLFREIGRSRIEADGGVGGSYLPVSQLRILGALSGRWHAADKGAHDLRGGSALASAELRLPHDWAVRAGALVGLDWYPNSAGYFDAAKPDTDRRDVLLKLSASGFSPAFAGIKVGGTYEYAERFSTTTPYSYRDHRLLLKVALSFATDPWGPRPVSPEGRVPLDHGASPSAFDERLQDLLRQDEAAQRSSSCVE